MDVEGEPVTTSSVSNLAKALGDDVNLVISVNPNTGKFQTYIPGSTPEGAEADIDIDGDTGLIVAMRADVSLSLRGQAWPGDVTLSSGINMIGIPLKDEEIASASDLAGKLGDDVNLIVSVNPNTGKFQTYIPGSTPEGAEADIDIDGDTGLIVAMRAESTLTVTGEPWSNENRRSGGPSAPQHTLINSNVTPVLAVDGMVVREDTGIALDNISVTVRHLSSGSVTTDTIGTADVGQFSVTIVDLSHNRAAQMGDTFEISFRDHSGQFDLEPIRHVVTKTDVQNGRIALGDVIAYLIPSHSALLANWPNPFNPDTWIPFQLSKAVNDVTLNIYDVNGSLVRTLTLGYVPAGIYQTKARAIYWDGTNDVGERVASGVYFYHLRAGKFSASRKMVILK